MIVLPVSEDLLLLHLERRSVERAALHVSPRKPGVRAYRVPQATPIAARSCSKFVLLSKNAVAPAAR